MHKTSELNLKERHFRPYSQVTLDRMALQLALTKARPKRLYIPKMVLDLGWFSLVERRLASLEKALLIYYYYY